MIRPKITAFKTNENQNEEDQRNNKQQMKYNDIQLFCMNPGGHLM